MNSPRIYSYQHPVFHALHATARVFFGGAWRSLPVLPRFARFVSGPTGAGKSHVVRELARVLRIPILQLSASAWIPLGANRRGAEVTWVDVAAFCGRNPRGIILIDELDKVRGESPWLDAIRPEIFSLIDGIFPEPALIGDEENTFSDNPIEREKIVCRLAGSMLVIGAGAFQSAWEPQAGVLGFHPTGLSSEAAVDHKVMAEEIPREIANRFVAPILCLPQLCEEDYRSMLDEVVGHLPPELATSVQRVALNSLHEAVDHAMGARWIQQSLLHALIEIEAVVDREFTTPAPDL